MSRRPSPVSDVDVALLKEVGRRASVVAAARALGISRDRAVYRLRRLARAFGGPVVVAERGGTRHGETRLTALGDRVAHGGFEAIELLAARPAERETHPNLLTGTYRAGPPPSVDVGRLALRVAFSATDGARVSLLLDPEAVLVARGRFPSSARNVLPGVVERNAPGPGPEERTAIVRVGDARLRVALTPETVERLGLARGRRVFLYVKATALRRVARPSSRGRRPR